MRLAVLSRMMQWFRMIHLTLLRSRSTRHNQIRRQKKVHQIKSLLISKKIWSDTIYSNLVPCLCAWGIIVSSCLLPLSQAVQVQRKRVRITQRALTTSIRSCKTRRMPSSLTITSSSVMSFSSFKKGWEIPKEGRSDSHTEMEFLHSPW